MDNIQAYTFLFNDSFATALIIIPRLSYAVDAMKAFGTYNLYLVFLVSLIANIIGCLINWIIGLLIRKLENFEKFADRAIVLKRSEVFFNNRGKWILLLSAVPFWGALFTVAAGVLHYRLSHFIILVAFSNFLALALKIFF